MRKTLLALPPASASAAAGRAFAAARAGPDGPRHIHDHHDDAGVPVGRFAIGGRPGGGARRTD